MTFFKSLTASFMFSEQFTRLFYDVTNIFLNVNEFMPVVFVPWKCYVNLFSNWNDTANRAGYNANLGGSPFAFHVNISK